MLEVLNVNNLLTQAAVLLLFTLSILYWFGTYNHDFWKKRGMKSPPMLPFVGNFFSISKPLPLLHLDYLKKYGKVFGMMQMRKPILFVADPMVIKRVLVQDFHMFRNRLNRPVRHPVMSKNLVSARYDQWKRIRSILTPMFTSSKLRHMEGLMSNCIDSMIDALGRVADCEGTFQVHNVMGNFTMDVIAKCAFATDTKAHDANDNVFVRNAREVFTINMFKTILTLLMPNFVWKICMKLGVPLLQNKGTDFFIDLSKHLVEERRNNHDAKYNDMLQLMVVAKHSEQKSVDKDDLFDAHHVNAGAEEMATEAKELENIIGSKYLSEDEITAQSVVFFLAGYETTASTLTFCMYELATNPDVQSKLYQEVKKASKEDPNLGYNTVMRLPYLDAVISETLRMHPPALTLGREAGERYHLPEFNYTIEKGEAIGFPIYAIHHLEEFYPNPDKFDPERFMPERRDQIIPYTYLPFGGGPRNCIGMRFALSEAKLGLAQIINRFELFKSPLTANKLDVHQCFVLLKTTPIHVGIRHRKD